MTKSRHIRIFRPREGDKLCENCNKIFHYIRSSNNPAPRACSQECQYKLIATAQRGKERKGTIGTPFKIKKAARRAVQTLVKRGLLVRFPCKECNSEIKTEGHHYLGYAKENWLNIVWLCPRCHYDEHERLRKEGKSSLL